MSLKSDLNRELKSRNLTLSDLNKKSNKQAKNDILAILTRAGILSKQSKQSLSKELRSLGLKFSDTILRDFYDTFAINPKKQSQAKLAKSKKPSDKNIPKLNRETTGKRRKNQYLYVIKLYMIPVRQKKGTHKNKVKKIPKDAIPVTNLKVYSHISDLALFDPERLSRNELIEKLKDYNFRSPQNNTSFDTSNSHQIDFKVFRVVAFEYRTILKDFE